MTQLDAHLQDGQMDVQWMLADNVGTRYLWKYHRTSTNMRSTEFCKIFNVLLTVHHAMILGNCPTWCTNSFQYIYLFIVLYMFRACHAHHQEKQIVSIQLLVIVTACWWQCRVLVGSLLPTSRYQWGDWGMDKQKTWVALVVDKRQAKAFLKKKHLWRKPDNCSTWAVNQLTGLLTGHCHCKRHIFSLIWSIPLCCINIL